MTPLIIQATETSPKITLDPSVNFFEITGLSRPDNAVKFYEPVVAWLEQYSNYLSTHKDEKPPEKIVFNMGVEYFNSISAKYLITLLFKLAEFKTKNKIDVEVNWQFDEDDFDLKETGQEFQRLLSIPFNFVEIKS